MNDPEDLGLENWDNFPEEVQNEILDCLDELDRMEEDDSPGL
ncbi:MAG: hypothetical protein WDZ51_16395 [Pirellulaceae bacterium]